MRKRGFFSLLLVTAFCVTAGSLYSCKDYDDEMYATLKQEMVDSNSSLGDIIELQKDELNALRDSLSKVTDELDQKQKDLSDRVDQTITKEEVENNYATIDSLEKYVGELAEVQSQMKQVQANRDSIDKILIRVSKNETNIKILLDWMTEMKSVEYATKAELQIVKNDLQIVRDSVNKVLSPKIDQLFDSLTNVSVRVKNNEGKLAEHQAILDGLDNRFAGLIAADSKLAKRIDSLAERGLAYDDSIQALKKYADEKCQEAKDLAKSYMDKVAQDLSDSMKIVNNKFETIEGELNGLSVRLGNMEEAYKEADKVLGQRIDGLQNDLNALSNQVAQNTRDLANLTSRFEDAMQSMITGILAQGAHSPVLGYWALPTGIKSQVLAAYYGYPDAKGKFPSTSSTNYITTSQAFTDVEAELLGLEKSTQSWMDGDCFVAEEGNAGTLYMTVNPVPKEESLVGKSFKLVNSLGENACVRLGTPTKSNHKLNFGYTRAGAKNGFYEVKATVDSADVQRAKLRLDLHDIKDAVKDVLTPSDGVDLSRVVSVLYTNVNDIADANAIEATWTDQLGEHSVYSDYGIAAVAVKPLSFKFMKDYQRDHFWGIDKAYKLLDKITGKFENILPEFPEITFENLPKIDTITLEKLTDEMLAEFVFTLDTTVYVKVDTVLQITIPTKEVQLDNFDASIMPGQVIKDIKVILQPRQGITVIEGDTVTVDIPGDTVYVDVPLDNQKVTINGPKVKIDSFQIEQNFKLSKGVRIYKTVDMREAVQELWGTMDEAIGDANEMVIAIKKFIDTDLQKMLDDLNGYTSKVESSLQDAIDNVKSELGGYIDKIDKKLCSLLESVNDRLQPTLLMKATKDFVLVSGSQNNPQRVASSSFVLVPTSYTAELVAPAYKKFVAVTDVVKNGESAKDNYMNPSHSSVKALKAANDGNADLNKVLPGSTTAIQVSGLEKGCVYEFTYSALDYHGFVVNTKHYVRVD